VQGSVTLVVQGSVARSDFLYWSPLHRLLECALFTIKASSNAFRIMVSTHVISQGITQFLNTECHDTSAKWYILDVTLKSTTVWNQDGEMVLSTSIGAGKSSYYLKQDSSRLEFGSVLERERVILSIPSFGEAKYLSFSTDYDSTLQVHDFATCDKLDEANDAGGAAVEVLDSFTVTDLNKYTLWPGGWTGNCVTFSTDFRRGGQVLIALANQPLGLFQSKSVPTKEAIVYELVVSLRRITLVNSGIIMQSSRVRLGRGNNTYRVRKFDDGKLGFEVFQANAESWKTLYSSRFPVENVRRFSLSSSRPRSFTNVQMC
jgi:hypothetical protein